MGDYNIDINVNMGGSAGNFQDLIASMNNLNASFQKVGTASKAAGDKSKQSFSDSARIMKQYGNDVNKVSAAIAGYKQKITEQGVALKQGTIIQKQHDAAVTRYAAKIKTLTIAQRQYNAVLGQTAVVAKTARASMAGLGAMANKIGAVFGVSLGLYGLVRALRATIKTISEFDLGQKKLRSILGETEVGMESLSKAAIKIGESSIFGASKVTDLQIALAKMGFVRGDIDNMTQSIVNFATALQEDLGQSAEVVANVLRAFQMDSSETGRVVDVMTKAFNTSALSLDNFRESIKYVAPVAKQAGFSFEETTSALALLANVGLKGSLAGTGLNNVLKAMMDSNSKLSKSLGGTVQGYEGFISVLKKARDEGWSSEKIFGLITQRATAAFTTMVKGVDKIEEYRLQLYKATGTAEKQSAIQMDTIANKAKLAGNAFGAMVLKLDSGSGAISTLIKGILVSFTDLVTASEGAVDAFKSQRKAVYDLNKDIVPLIDRYDELKKVTPKTKEEQAELELIILKVTDAIPGAVKGFDRYGEALDINAKKARAFIEDQILLMKYLNDEGIKKAQSELDKVNSKIGIARRFYEELLRTGEIIDTEKRGGYLQDKVIRRKATQEEIADAKAKFQKLEEQQRTYLAVISELNGDAMLEEARLRKKADEQAAAQAKKDEETSTAIKRLEDEKKIAQERIKLKYDGDHQIRKIAQSTADFDKRIADLSITNEDEYARAITLINLKLANDLKGIRTKSSLDALKIEQSRNETLLQGLGDGFEKEQALMKSNYEYGLKILEQTEKGNENIKEKIADYNEKYFLKMEDAERKHAIEVLKIQEELNQLNIQIKFEGYEENLKLRESAMKSEIAILVERNLATEEHNKEYEKIQLKYKALTVKDEVAFQKELTQLVYEGEILRGEIEGNSLNIRREAINKWFDFESSKLDKTAVNFDQAMKNLVAQKELKFKELEQGKSLYELLFPDAGGAELAAMEESVGIITDNISKIADSWVDATDKIVDQYNRRVDEAAKALDTEVALMAAGYASNVTLKKKELDELKKQRDKALDEQQRAQKAQLIINSAMQASDLALTVAGLFKSGVKLAGIPGLLIAAAASASLFAMFKSFQNLAKQQSAVKFEKGGWIGGERHSRGGTHIEAERGEFVVRRNSAIKHKSLIEAINSDNQYEMNRIYLNKVKGQIFSGKVSLDDSKDLKAIRALMEKQGKTVEYSGSYRIEKVGNITTKIRLN